MSNLSKGRRIFVVDDEPVIASTLGEILRRQGFDVTTFTDPIEALKALQTNAPEFLIADVVMPKISGIDLAIVIREACPGCTVLLFSGQLAVFEMVENARSRGHHFDILAKPVHPIEIVQRVRAGLGIDPPAAASTNNVQ